MQIKVNRTNSANAQVEATISTALIDKTEAKITAQAASTMKIDGFRKGKVPAHVVKARYGKQLREDAKTEVLKELYNKALTELDVKTDAVIGEPGFTKYEENENGLDLVLELTFKYKEACCEYKTYIYSRYFSRL